MSNRDIVVAAVRDLFGTAGAEAVDRWVAPDYRQHSALAADGQDGLRKLLENLPTGFSYDPVRVLADGDLVALHGIYHGIGTQPQVAFDIFRVADGLLAEHWDGLTPQVNRTVSGRSQTDGPTTVTEPGKTEDNRALVSDFARQVLIGADYGVLTDFISTTEYDQHNPEAADGLDGFGAAAATWAGQGKNLDYTTVHKTIADGDFVLLQSEGTFGVPVVYYDLFRVADGKIIEHWDVIAPIPDKLPHDNGVF
ncbi:nuclear transport factor 2 family protein [Nocardia sp. NPDC050406]|uniref:nuclear transport factor 2 family protein n=1 Tax=Nocardia sp. NPDC050406 TaxID=3364318 RepID=UPI0037AE2FF7